MVMGLEPKDYDLATDALPDEIEDIFPDKPTIPVGKQFGTVVVVEGDEPYAEVLRQRFTLRAENKNIAELGVGTNELATRPDNILESEKIKGTIHLGLVNSQPYLVMKN